MKYLNWMIILAVCCSILSACQKDDYINDGGKANANVNMTTYDFLKSNPKFDSLIKVIDHAGLKDEVNSGITFFASTNYSVAAYVASKKREKIIETGDENISFGINDISVQDLDSLRMYMFDGAIGRDKLTTKSTFFENKFGPIANVRFMINLRRDATTYSNYLDYVDYVRFTEVVGTVDADLPKGTIIPTEEEDMGYDCQTSGIITTTGVLHVLADTHRLMFNRSVGSGD